MSAHNQEDERRRRFQDARRVVIKLGTSVVTGAGGEVCIAQVKPIVRAIVKLTREGRGVVLVSSGAVGLGAGRLGLARARLGEVVVRQACAAIGQSLLMNAYEHLFRRYDVKIAQVLLTEDDFRDRQRYANLQRTMEKLLKFGVVPIVNENDTVSTAELEYLPQGGARVFSDNDRLAALVMSKLDSEALVLLTDVDGLFARRPTTVRSAPTQGAGVPVIPLVTDITPELKSLATGPSAGGRGGMLTKLEAADIAMRAGGVAVIANGTKPDTLPRIFKGEAVGTAFLPTARMAGKRRWIAYAASARGRIVVNAGAREAILRGKASLLTSGLVRVEREFDAHDVVSIADPEGREFARGIANCASEQLIAQIKAQRESPTPDAIRTRKGKVFVTRDNIVILESKTEEGQQKTSVVAEG